MADVDGYNGAYTGAQIDAGIAKANRAIPKVLTLTLSSSAWSSNSQKVTASGVSATETAQIIYIVPVASSKTNFINAGITCTAQAANSLTFTRKNVVNANISVYAVIQSLT